ncbi:MAG: phytoene desaturase family protein [Chitinophagaceae bacterium]
MPKKVIIIGAGFSGLSAASFMARAGWEVHVFERHAQPGGRARQLSADGFVFDMGPSWYWMPDIFERYFNQFGKTTQDFYKLKRLDPSYRVYWDEGFTDLPSDLEEMKALFESMEPGAALQLDKFLGEAAFKYKAGMKKLVFKPGRSLSEFIDLDVLTGIFRLDLFTSMQKHVAKFFNHPRIRKILEFPVLFLGALPTDTPALYSLMNYADIVGGTWYPEGGMYSIVKGMEGLAKELGVHFHYEQEVEAIIIEDRQAKGIKSRTRSNEAGVSALHNADVIIGAGDYHFIEKHLLPSASRSYSDAYWDSRKMAPSCILYYVGLNKKIGGLQHHSLFFDVPFEEHANEIYVDPSWPENPLFYVCASSVTDASVAPAGCENLFFLIPVAAGLEGDSEEKREAYFLKILSRMEKQVGENILDSITFKRSFGITDFKEEYHSFKGNAYGLANTLRQTAILKPSCRSKKVKNLFYAGQLTVPGPGVPPSLVSGEVVAGEVIKHF